MGETTNKAHRPSIFVMLTGLLASVKFAVALVVVIAVACVVGTLLPQGTDALKYVQQNPAAAGRFELFGQLGLTHLFHSWWFVGLLGALAASVFTCSARRFATVRRTTGYARGRAFGSMLTHISFLLILGGAVIRGVWGQKGYVEFREGQTVREFVTETGRRPLPFAVRLTKFEIETYAADPAAPAAPAQTLVVAWPEKKLQRALPIKVGVAQAFDAFQITVLQYIPDFVVDMSTREVRTRSQSPNNPAILVAVAGPNYQNHRWLFAKFPEFTMHGPDSQAGGGASPLQLRYVSRDRAAAGALTGPVKSFKSTLAVAGRAVTLEVNRPFRHQGYTFYQSGYNPNDLSYTSLQVVNDPGVPLVYAGFGLMLAGLFIVFYLNPWLAARRKEP